MLGVKKCELPEMKADYFVAMSLLETAGAVFRDKAIAVLLYLKISPKVISTSSSAHQQKRRDATSGDSEGLGMTAM